MADSERVKGLEKLTSIRLAEVLTQRGSVDTDAITDALYAQDRQGEVFVDMLVANGQITEWDLAKIVVEHFQLPFIMASSYEVSEEAKSAFPKELLFQHRIVPLDLHGEVATIVLPILTPYEVLLRLQEKAKVELFPYVGLTSENTRVLGQLFPDYADWAKEEEARKAQAARSAKAAGGADGKGGGGQGRGPGDWMDMFDSADASVRDGLK